METGEMSCFYDLTQEIVDVWGEDDSSNFGANSENLAPKEEPCPAVNAIHETPASKHDESLSSAPEETPRGGLGKKETPASAAIPTYTGNILDERHNLLDVKSPSIKLLLLRQDETEQGDTRLTIEKILDLKSPVNIGRRVSQSPQITNGLFNDRMVSRNHAILYAEGDKVILHDIGSSHGTFVNGQRVMTFRALHDGDRVNLGQLSGWKTPYIVQIIQGTSRKEAEDDINAEQPHRGEAKKRKREIDASDDVAHFIFNSLDNVESRIAKRIRVSSAISAIVGGVIGGLSVGCTIVGLANLG